jgi:hypothetical protein
MIIVTNLAKCLPVDTTGSIVGFGNHNFDTSDCYYVFDLVFEKRTEEKAVFSSKEELYDFVMIPACEKAGFTNPKAKAYEIYRLLVAEGKIINTEKSE